MQDSYNWEKRLVNTTHDHEQHETTAKFEIRSEYYTLQLNFLLNLCKGFVFTCVHTCDMWVNMHAKEQTEVSSGIPSSSYETLACCSPTRDWYSKHAAFLHRFWGSNSVLLLFFFFSVLLLKRKMFCWLNRLFFERSSHSVD